MNRRHFLTAIGGATAAATSLTHLNQALASQAATPFYAKGLIMVSFEDSKMLRLGLPKASGHKATLSMVPQSGSQRVLSLKGDCSVKATTEESGKRDYKIPELIRMQEIYGNSIHSRIEECPTVIRIPYAAIQSITAVEVSPTRYAFVRADNGQEITTFRPRQVAETLKIDLSSDAVLKIDGKAVALNSLKEVHTEYAPEDPAAISGIDAFTAHFPHYNAYLDLPANAKFAVLPKNLGPTPKTTPRIGNNLVQPYWPYYACFIVGI